MLERILGIRVVVDNEAERLGRLCRCFVAAGWNPADCLDHNWAQQGSMESHTPVTSLVESVRAGLGFHGCCTSLQYGTTPRSESSVRACDNVHHPRRWRHRAGSWEPWGVDIGQLGRLDPKRSHLLTPEQRDAYLLKGASLATVRFQSNWSHQENVRSAEVSFYRLTMMCTDYRVTVRSLAASAEVAKV